MLLALIGLYGALSYLVTLRRTEFGIRMALGALPQSILDTVMKDVAVVLISGVGAGACLSFLVVPRRSPAPENALRPESSRSCNDGNGDWPAVGGCAPGQLSPGTPRDARRPHGGAALRIAFCGEQEFSGLAFAQLCPSAELADALASS
jgi:hypothetical protein